MEHDANSTGSEGWGIFARWQSSATGEHGGPES
jgi:hypothetical protein